MGINTGIVPDYLNILDNLCHNSASRLSMSGSGWCLAEDSAPAKPLIDLVPPQVSGGIAPKQPKLPKDTGKCGVNETA